MGGGSGSGARRLGSGDRRWRWWFEEGRWCGPEGYGEKKVGRGARRSYEQKKIGC